MSGYEHELRTAIEAVRDAAKVCQSVQSSLSMDAMKKADQSPVTVADFGSQAMVCRVLGQQFPHDPIIAEEDATELKVLDNAPFLHRIHEEICRQCIEASPDEICRWIDRGSAEDYSQRFWTLDPIDGTKGFLRGEQYAVSLALIVAGELQVGVVACPNLMWSPAGGTPETGWVFFASRGQGAFAEPLADAGSRVPVSVSTRSTGPEAVLCESVESGHSNHDRVASVRQLMGITAESQRLDSQAKYAVVASGSADIYLRLPTKADYREWIWDHAGGVIVVEEAGGHVTDLAGAPLDWTQGPKLQKNQGIVVTNGRLHPLVMNSLRAIGL